MEVGAGQGIGIGSKAQDNGSLCDAFLLFGDYADSLFISFVSVLEPGGK